MTLLAVGMPAESPAREFGVRAVYWFPELSGNVFSLTAGVPDTTIDVKNTLGVEDENVLFGEASLSLGRVTLRVGYTPLKFDGTSRLNEAITFNGTTYPVSDVVQTRFELSMLDGSAEVAIFRPDYGDVSLNLGLMLLVKYVDAEVRLSSGTSGSASEDFQGPVPMPGVTAGIGFFRDRIRADFRAAAIAYSDNRLIDLEAFLSFSPIPLLSLQGGYRYVHLKIDEDDFFADVDIKGPYAGLRLSF
jgi:hypothetical protein